MDNSKLIQNTNQILESIKEAGITATSNENLQKVNGSTVNVGTGASGSGTQRVTTSTDSTIATITNPINGVIATATASGTSRFRSLTTNSTAQAIKASAGNLYGWNIINLTDSRIYVKIYNIAAASVNPASDVPIKTLMVSAYGAVYQEPNCIQTSASTALSVRTVTESGDTGTTAPSTSPIIEIEYI